MLKILWRHVHKQALRILKKHGLTTSALSKHCFQSHRRTQAELCLTDLVGFHKIETCWRNYSVVQPSCQQRRVGPDLHCRNLYKLSAISLNYYLLTYLLTYLHIHQSW